VLALLFDPRFNLVRSRESYLMGSAPLQLRYLCTPHPLERFVSGKLELADKSCMALLQYAKCFTNAGFELFGPVDT
jgi:hypothetical protein